MAVGLIAFALRFLSWGEAVICAAAATLFNAMVLPRLAGRTLLRPVEAGSPWRSGLVIYPFSVLLLVVAFRGSPDLAAAAWAILAFGDGAATLAGRAAGAGSRRWPWNPAKSMIGTAAFVVAGGVGACALAWWTGPAVEPLRPWWMLTLVPLLAAGAAGLVETLPIRMDDNLSVPFAAGLVLWTGALVDPHALEAAGSAIWPRVPAAVVVNAAVAALSWRLGAVSRSGVVGGLAIGLSIWLFGGGPAWALLFATFVVASAASKLGLRRKVLLGIEQERGGRRGAGNALANCLVAAVASVVSLLGATPEAARVVMAAALIAGASDTVASEIGKAFGRRTWSPLTLGPVAPGTIGGMSLEGTAAGVLAAAALATFASLLGVVSLGSSWIIVTAASLAMIIEGVLGATLEPRGIINNDVLNFLDTFVAGALALALRYWLGA